MIFTLTTTKTGEPCVEMHDGKILVAKVYPNADSSKIRIVLPELVNYKQTLVDPDAHWLEFSRDPNSSLPNASRAPVAAAKLKCNVLGCQSMASFIIKKIAYCEQHRRLANG